MDIQNNDFDLIDENKIFNRDEFNLFTAELIERGANENLIPDYADYLEYMKGEDGLSAFVAASFATPEIRTQMVGKMIPPVVRDEIIRQGARLGGDVMRRAAQKAGIDMTNMSTITRSAGEAIRKQMGKRIKDTITNTSSSDPNTSYTSVGDVPPPPSGGSSNGYSGGSRWNPYGLSLNNKAIETEFSTDIKTGYSTRYFLDGGDNTTPLIIKYCVPAVITTNNSSSDIFNYFQGPIISKWISQVQQKITWTNQVATGLTAVKILEYFNTLSLALNIYYFYVSIIAYANNTKNKNQAITRLYDALDADDLNSLSTLKIYIESVPVPPFLNRLIFYLNGCYKQTSLPGSPLMKISPISFSTSSTAYFTTLNGGSVSEVLGMLENPTFRDTQALLARSISDWNSVELFNYTGLPRHDGGFTTWFTNLVYRSTNSIGTRYLPFTDNIDDVYPYALHTDDPDGWTNALSSVSIDNVPYPGLASFCRPNRYVGTTTPITSAPLSSVYVGPGEGTYSTSCVIFTKDEYDGVLYSGFWPVEHRQAFQSVAGNSFTTYQNAVSVNKFQRFGTQAVEFQTPKTSLIAAQELCDLLYAIETTSGKKKRRDRGKGGQN